MNRLISAFLFLLVITSSTFSYAAVFHSGDKVYIDPDSFKANTKGDEFYIHTGHNIWLVTHTINRDATGLFSYESNLSRSMEPGQKADYVKRWKCPYCYSYWPIGTPCQNPDCPSKYK